MKKVYFFGFLAFAPCLLIAQDLNTQSTVGEVALLEGLKCMENYLEQNKSNMDSGLSVTNRGFISELVGMISGDTNPELLEAIRSGLYDPAREMCKSDDFPDDDLKFAEAIKKCYCGKFSASSESLPR